MKRSLSRAHLVTSDPHVLIYKLMREKEEFKNLAAEYIQKYFDLLQRTSNEPRRNHRHGNRLGMGNF